MIFSSFKSAKSTLSLFASLCPAPTQKQSCVSQICSVLNFSDGISSMIAIPRSSVLFSTLFATCKEPDSCISTSVSGYFSL